LCAGVELRKEGHGILPPLGLLWSVIGR
jgi:hypothetical protein